MRKTPKVLTSQQHSQWSAAFLVAAIIITAIVFGQGDAAKAVAMIFSFILGALCASHGAKSREKKMVEGIAANDQSMRDTQEVYRKFLREKREKQKQ